MPAKVYFLGQFFVHLPDSNTQNDWVTYLSLAKLLLEYLSRLSRNMDTDW